MQLEDLQPRCAVRGVHPDGLVTVVSVQWFGSEAVELTYKTQAGAVANELLYRHDETRLEVVAEGRPWSFDGDGALFRLVSEAQRIRLAHLFDPLLAIHTSVVDPLPHQITGVYDAMLPRQPLRFLLADDPGAGKTIMAGLLIKELVARGDLERCLIVCPGSLAEQWQDELYRRFQLPFEILTNDKLEAARTRNWSSAAGPRPSARRVRHKRRPRPIRGPGSVLGKSLSGRHQLQNRGAEISERLLVGLERGDDAGIIGPLQRPVDGAHSLINCRRNSGTGGRGDSPPFCKRRYRCALRPCSALSVK